jgi:CelD/BcsL family acetyltransferase involved in cellulose biosynthesis
MTIATAHRVPAPPAPVPRVVTIDPIADPRWADLVGRAPAATVFHHPAWLALLRAQYGYAIRGCCVAALDGRLVGGLPVAEVATPLRGRRLVAVPFSDLCPPLVEPQSPGGAAALAAALDADRRARALPLQVRGPGEVLAGAHVSARFHHHVLALGPDVDRVVHGFRRGHVAQGVRRARRLGLVAERRTDRAALETFYRLHAITRARLGVATQPRRFILRFADLFAAGLGFVLLVRDGERPIAAAVFLTHRDVLTYKFGASEPRALGMRPNNLLFMEAIRWGCEHGMRALDLGRTDIGHEGLRGFKLAWGSEEHELAYVELGESAPHRTARRIEAVLGAATRRGGPRTSRLAGELLYRYAA